MSSEEEEYESALNGGDKSARTKLAWFMLSGRANCTIDERLAVDLLKGAVREGDTEAMWMLGLCYEYGRGTDKDSGKAVSLYKQSADGKNKIGELLHENMSKYSFAGEGKLVIRNASSCCEIASSLDFGELNRLMPVAPFTKLSIDGDPYDEDCIDLEGANALYDALKGDTTLTELCISAIEFEEGGEEKIRELRKVNTALKTLEIDS